MGVFLSAKDKDKTTSNLLFRHQCLMEKIAVLVVGATTRLPLSIIVTHGGVATAGELVHTCPHLAGEACATDDVEEKTNWILHGVLSYVGWMGPFL